MVELNILLNFVGMVFETFIIVISAVLLVLIIKKYFIKRHNLTRLLLIIFTCYLLAIIFSWISKVIVFTQLSVIQDGSIIAWMYNLIVDFRVSEFFVTIAIFLSYILKVNVFEKGYNAIHKYIIIIYGIFACVYVLIIYELDNTLLDIVAFLIVFIYMVMVYVPFLRRAIQSYRGVEEKVYKQAFLSLAIMSFSFTLIFLNFAIDRVLIFLGSPGFTVFYFLAWISAIVGIFGTYYGYIRPKSSEK
ncbi:MAG: ABC transporter ATP-binding protein [Candidatus Lokiarchaeota archaeon]|nr:ABC transporter ATP-binding protein [Candidatus Lokiarchaeota archaeon]